MKNGLNLNRVKVGRLVLFFTKVNKLISAVNLYLRHLDLHIQQR